MQDLNTAFSNSEGKYVVFIASDDILEPKSLEITSKYLDANPNVGVFYSSFTPMNEDGSIIADKKNVYVNTNNSRFDLLEKMFFVRNQLTSPGMMIRRSALKKIYPLDLPFIHTQDYRMHIELLLTEEMYQSEQRLVKYRLPNQNSGISNFCSATMKREELEEQILLDSYLK